MNATNNPEKKGRELLISQLRAETAVDFTNHRLLDRIPWLFSDRSQYITWKSELAADLEVDPFMIVVVGSAATGYSLAPQKNFSAFGQRSDIDTAVVSQRHFDEAWRWLRELGPIRLLRRGSIEHDMLNWHRRNLVFDGAIETDKLLPRLPFGAEWATGLGRAGKREPTIGRPVKIRLYRDFASLRQYHVAGITELKNQLDSVRADIPPVTLPQRDGDGTVTDAPTHPGDNS